jgi:hypothetical protein
VAAPLPRLKVLILNPDALQMTTGFATCRPLAGVLAGLRTGEQEVTWHEKLEVPRSVSRHLILPFNFSIVEQQEGPLLPTPDVQQVACPRLPYPLGR